MEHSLRNKLIAAAIAVFLVLALLAAGFTLSFLKARDLSEKLTEATQKISDLQSSLNESQEKATDQEQKNTDLQQQVTDLQQQVKELESRRTSSSGSTDKKVYLTFDDGPSANTPQILSILKQYDAKATFFVINGKYNDYMKDIVDSGNAIGLHTFTHDYAQVYASDDAFYSDLQQISDVVKSETGLTVKITRFPGGSSNTVSRKYSAGIMTRLTQSLSDKGYVYFDWNCSNGDASANHVPVDRLVSNLKSSAGKMEGNVCVLMHDTAAKDTTVEALPQIITYFKDRGFSFEVLTEKTIPIHHSKVNN